MEPSQIAAGVFVVGGPEVSDPRDCLCYLVKGPRARVLIDCGAGPSAGLISNLASKAGRGAPTDLLLTHAHIDHVGGAAEVRRLTGCRVFIHQAEAEVLAQGDAQRSAATWYGLDLKPCPPDEVFSGDAALDLGQGRILHVIHTPGHTPGSMSAWCLASGLEVLFGQDIHGPFSPSFGSDVNLWAKSMARLLALEADVLAEGHFGVFQPAEEARAFIEAQLAAQGFRPGRGGGREG